MMSLSLLFLLFIINTKSLDCSCFHIQDQTLCQKSPRCQWDNEFCQININFQPTMIKQCSEFNISNCPKFRCLQQDNTCIGYKPCQEYVNQMNCLYQNDQGKYCYWGQSQCRDVQICEELPQFLSDMQCRNAWSICTVNIKGGCILSGLNCEDQQFASQCFQNRNQQQKCIWNNSKCVDEKCELYYFQSEQECKNIMSICTTNGFNCVEKSSCSNITLAEYCTTDNQKQECIWIVDQCFDLICQNAPTSYITLTDCQNFKSDCISKANGGCKLNSKHCSNYETQESCLAFGCQWENQCYNQGPLICESYTHQASCESANCFFHNNQCKVLECTDLKKPEYDTHLKCNTQLIDCTIGSDGCIKLICENIVDDNICLNGNGCKLEQYCEERQCSNAPSPVNHNDCVQWKKDCTIQNNSCMQQLATCSQYQNQQQCVITINGINCSWNGSNCINAICSDSLTNDCDNWKTAVGICIPNGTSCIQKTCITAPNTLITNVECRNWMSNCALDDDQMGCKIANNVGCSFTGTSHEECNAWNNQCTISRDILGQGCTEILADCTQYEQNQCSVNNCLWDGKMILIKLPQKVDGLHTHQSCEDYLQECTSNSIYISCNNKYTSCLPFTIDNCYEDSYKKKCYWDINSNSCRYYQCSDNTTAIAEFECLQNDGCQLSNLTQIGCEPKPTTCSTILTQSICNQTILISGQRCYFATTCQLITDCSLIVGPITDQQCRSYNYLCMENGNGTSCVSFAKIDCTTISNSIDCNNVQYCHFSVVCLPVNNCSDLPLQSSCTKITFQKNRQCRWNFTSVQCQEIGCSFYSSTVNVYTCFNWGGDCVPNSTNTACQTFTNCNQITFYLQCVRNPCYWLESGGGCQDSLDCRLNTTATTELECHEYHPYCQLAETGCNFIDCSYIPQSICNNFKLQSGQKCSYNVASQICRNFDCTDFSTNCAQVDGSCYFNGVNCSILPNCFHANTITNCLLSQKNGFQCQWNLTSCSMTMCSSLLNPSSYEDCNSFSSNCGVNVTLIPSTDICIQKQSSCNLYTFPSQCTYTLSGIRCFWSTSCLPATCPNYPGPVFSHNLCNKYLEGCIGNITFTQCVQASSDCSAYLTSAYCNGASDFAGKKCVWISSCIIRNCSNYNGGSPNSSNCWSWDNCLFDGVVCYERHVTCGTYSSVDCSTVQNKSGIQCTFFNSQCVERTCSNYQGPIFNQSNCENWLKNCTANIYHTSCTLKIKCSQAPITYDTHQKCQSFMDTCTVVGQSLKCAILPSSCSDATEEQCHKDIHGNQCYWTGVYCSNLYYCDTLTSTTHEYCYSKSINCTINNTLNKCMDIKYSCTQFTLAQQCHFQNNLHLPCAWYQSQCQLKSCQTAVLAIYSIKKCQNYFNTTCTINFDGTGCMVMPANCSQYTQFQCTYSEQTNLSGQPCVWMNNQCQERDCSNILSNCEQYNCKTTNFCQTANCDDFNYASEYQCKQILPKFQCTTDGIKCVNRSNCQSVIIQEACTFSIDFEECIWFNNTCTIRQCITAPYNLHSEAECEQYFPNNNCTTKLFGGCVQKSSCAAASVQEACTTNINNEQCVFDQLGNKCVDLLCTSHCGDGILQYETEECDDGNDIPFDGCFKCKMQCVIGCDLCEGLYCEQCSQPGWYQNDQGSCETKCGDSLVIGQEECDDGNLIPYDGCNECKFECHPLCIDCQLGKCYQCQLGWYVNDTICIPKCGDGIKIDDEQCDDGNIINSDGCNSDCQMESNWICKEYLQLSQCFPNDQVHMKIKDLTGQAPQESVIEITFSVPLKLSTEKEVNLFTFSIDNYTFQNITLFSTQLGNPKYILRTQEYPIVNISINNTYILNQYNINVNIPFQIVKLKELNLLSEMEVKISQATNQFTEIMIYLIVAIVCIAVICGNLDIFWNTLDLLQQLSYFQYINLPFPKHLQDYFDLFSIVSIQPILDFLQISYLFQSYQSIPFINPGYKFERDEINAYFLINFESLFIVNCSAYCFYLLTILLSKPLNNINLFKFTLISQPRPNVINKFINKVKDQIKLFILRSFMNFRKMLRLYQSNYYYSGIIRILHSSMYDLAFVTLLQIANPSFQTQLLFFNQILTYFVFFTLMNLLIFQYSKLTVQIQKNSNLKQWKALYEGLKTSGWNKQFSTLNILKKVIFMYVLTFWQSNPLPQTLLISLNHLFFAGFLYISHPIINYVEFLKVSIQELIIVLTTLTFIVYELPPQQITNYTINIFGWIHIFCFSSSLFIQLALDVYTQIVKVKKNILNRKQTEKSDLRVVLPFI